VGDSVDAVVGVAFGAFVGGSVDAVSGEALGGFETTGKGRADGNGKEGDGEDPPTPTLACCAVAALSSSSPDEVTPKTIPTTAPTIRIEATQKINKRREGGVELDAGSDSVVGVTSLSVIVITSSIVLDKVTLVGLLFLDLS
jgi:hypothetical protein